MFAERQISAARADGWRACCRICTSDQGATAIEYALLAAFIAGVIFLSLVGLGDSLRDLPFPALIEALSGQAPS